MANSTPKSGSELLAALDLQASMELKSTRLLVEEACFKDIESYWVGSGLGEVSLTALNSLITPSIAGGQWGFNNLLTRLEKLGVAREDQESIANDILELVSRHAKVLNYARFRCGAIQSYVSQTNEVNFVALIADLGNSEAKLLRKDLELLLAQKVSDVKSLREWALGVDELIEALSVEQEKSMLSKPNEFNRGRKGSLSTKSISSYSKHWLSFIEEKIVPLYGAKTEVAPSETTPDRARYLHGYTSLSWSEIQKQLKETLSSRRVFKGTKPASRSLNSQKSSKLITEVSDLGGRNLRITYNLSGLDADLIKPTINLLRGQLIRNPKAPIISAHFESDVGSLTVELENPRKSDLADVEIQLSSHL